MLNRHFTNSQKTVKTKVPRFVKYSEFEVQALAYWRLKAVFHDNVRGEYKVKRREEGKFGARLDIVIFDNQGKMALVIEVKKSDKGYKETQGIRYAELTGCPYMYIRGIEQADNAVELVTKKLEYNVESLLC